MWPGPFLEAHNYPASLREVSISGAYIFMTANVSGKDWSLRRFERLIAKFRNIAMLAGPLAACIACWSSLKATSRMLKIEFSIVQCDRAIARNCSGVGECRLEI